MEMAAKTGLPAKVIKHWFRNTLFKVSSVYMSLSLIDETLVRTCATAPLCFRHSSLKYVEVWNSYRFLRIISCPGSIGIKNNLYFSMSDVDLNVIDID